MQLDQFDHAVEASIDIPSGKLVVMGYTGYLPDAQRVEVSPGTYRVLSLASGIASIQTESEPANDLYTVYLWRGDSRPPRLLKHWKGADALYV